jgi:hypothetical protein
LELRERFASFNDIRFDDGGNTHSSNAGSLREFHANRAYQNSHNLVFRIHTAFRVELLVFPHRPQDQGIGNGDGAYARHPYQYRKDSNEVGWQPKVRAMGCSKVNSNQSDQYHEK